MSFASDKAWSEAKQVVGNDGDWLDIISYYRYIGGRHVFVYSVIDGVKRLIIDVLEGDIVLLLNNQGSLEMQEYTEVLESRKVFTYSKDTTDQEYKLNGQKINITIEGHKLR